MKKNTDLDGTITWAIQQCLHAMRFIYYSSRIISGLFIITLENKIKKQRFHDRYRDLGNSTRCAVSH